jgi:phosphate transport system substrate-binding protein
MVIHINTSSTNCLILQRGAFIMGQRLYPAIIFFGILFLVVGCAQQGKIISDEKTQLRIAGSGSGIAILKIVNESFENAHPGIGLNFLPSTSTVDGMIGVSQGLLDIGSAARKLTVPEKELHPGIVEYSFVKDALVMCVNPNVGVMSLTKDEIKRIYAGNITDWSQVGGQKGKIVVFDREETDSSKILLREHILGQGTPVTKDAIVLQSSDSMHASVEATRDSIGQCSLGGIRFNGVSVKSLALDGIIASASTIRDGSYPLVRDFGIIVKKEGLNPATEVFIKHIFSEEAKEVLARYGYFPSPKD